MKRVLARTMRYLPLFALFGLISCAANKIKTDQPLQLNNVGTIELHIETAIATLSTENMAKTIANNLRMWHYPVGEHTETNVTHRLTATIEAISHGNTPSGFSFSAGNSDPRALEFQKMDVLPIRCRLTSTRHPEQTSELSMGFTADSTHQQALTTDKLSDHISTVCFNLLQEVDWPIKDEANKTTTHTPSWMPEIRIESKNVDSNGSLVPAPSTSPPSVSTPSTNSVPTTVKVNPSEKRKAIIIYNQGSPIILHFGHERR